ncbi:MAG TPA: hypothetical protein VHD83_16050 [Puia sp.]|nr:hypothetical protein [Puia sp.]
MKRLLLAAVLFLAVQGFGQDIHAIEQDLLQKYDQIHHWSPYNNNENYSHHDSLEKANKVFHEALLHYTIACPATLDAPFRQLTKAGLTITTSDDGLFRIYSWDTETGGTLHYFSNIYQYKNAHGTHARPDPPPAPDDAEKYGVACYSNIYALPVNGKRYYLAISNAILGGKDQLQSIQAFSMTEHGLDDSARIIRTSEGLVSSIDVEYDFFSVADQPERPAHLIGYDSIKKIISIPAVKHDGTVTKGRLLYQFTGKYFKYIGSISPR